MSNGTVSASPSQLTDASHPFKAGSTTASTTKSDLETAVQGLVGDLGAVSQLSEVSYAVSTLQSRMTTSLGCLEDALGRTSLNLLAAAGGFQSTDELLKSVFIELENEFPGYDGPGSQPQHGDNFFQWMWHGTVHGYHDFVNWRNDVQHFTHNIPIIGPLISPSDPGSGGAGTPGDPGIPADPMPIEVPLIPVP